MVTPPNQISSLCKTNSTSLFKEESEELIKVATAPSQSLGTRAKAYFSPLNSGNLPLVFGVSVGVAM